VEKASTCRGDEAHRVVGQYDDGSDDVGDGSDRKECKIDSSISRGDTAIGPHQQRTESTTKPNVATMILRCNKTVQQSIH
jgi:hypothetical protein